jgi:site-specific recombinase XerD
MKQETFSVLFFTTKKRVLKNGEVPVLLRVTINGSSAECRIQRSVPVHLWNQAKGFSKGKDPKSLELNDYIRSLNLKLLTIHKELSLKEAHFTPNLLLDMLFGKVESDDHKRNLLAYFRSHADDCRKLIGIDYAYSTINRYDNCIKSLEAMIQRDYGKDDISFNELNGEFIRKYEIYLKTEKALANNTLVRYMKAFKKVTNLALADEYLKRDPFMGAKYKQDETNPTFLTKEELETIMNKEFAAERLNLVKNVFLFCSFTGLAFIDAKELRPEHLFRDNNGYLWIRKGRQKIKRNKAICTSNVPLLSVAQNILESYKDHPVCVSKGVCLPVLSNQKVNSYLKEIADFCGIKKNLTTHVARHTFGTMITI